MAEQKGAGTDVPGRHTEAALAVRGRAAEPGEGREPEAREAEAGGSGPRPDDRSGIQWWEACGGWSARYAMGTF